MTRSKSLLMPEPLKLYIGGDFVDASDGATYHSINPANGEPIIEAPWATVADADHAVRAAREAFDHGPWRDTSAADRHALLIKLADLLDARKDDFALMEVKDAGALIGKTPTDLFLCVKQLKYFAKMALNYDGALKPVESMQRPGRSKVFSQREPIGVCAQLIPWNFPLTMAVWKLGPALATGNTLVLKCAPETPWSALELGRLCDQAGFPPGVVNIITGDAEVGQALVNHPLVDKIAFTGSSEVGRLIMSQAAGTMKKVSLECGGKSANLVLPDADPEIAVDGSLYATFFHAGQICVSGTRLLLQEQKYADFVERMVARTEAMVIGDPMDPATTMGPVVSQKQLDRVLGYIDTGRREGATVAVGGGRASGAGLEKGFFVKPTIFTEVTNNMTIAREEIFGPVLSVLRYGDVEEAVRIANDSEYGLAAGVWSRDLDGARQVASRLRAGMVWINEWHVISEQVPFGGYKGSGLGKELGEEGLNAYTEQKTLYQDDCGERDKKFWYDVILPRNE